MMTRFAPESSRRTPYMSFTGLTQGLLGRLFLTLLLLLAALAPVRARGGEVVTCALVADPALGFPDSAAFNLLATQLAGRADLALLERADVARLLRERSLQFALAAEGVGARRELGTLLKAQLLVILRAGEQSVNGRTVRFIDMVIAETSSGLRLAQDRLVWDENAPQALAQPVADRLEAARRRLAEPVRAILAVPPFVSDDLDHRDDALQAAYARLLIESFAATPGLRLVELAEARALAGEQRLTGNAPLRREMMPCTLSGRYRHEGRGDARIVRLALELTRGAESLGKSEGTPMAPGEAAGRLRRDAGDLLARSLKVTPAPFDAQAESAALARKAGQFRALGEWETAFTLTEAALLLTPDDLALHRQAVACATPLIERVDTSKVESLRRAVATGLGALEHFEVYLRRTDFNVIHENPDRWKNEQDFVLDFWGAGRHTLRRRLDNSEHRALVTELGKAKREFMIAWLETQAERSAPKLVPNLTPPDTDWREAGRPFIGVDIDEPPAETAEALLRMARAICKASRGKDVIVISNLARTRLDDSQARAELLAKIAELPGPQYPLLVRIMRVEGEPDTRQRLEKLGNMMVEVSEGSLEGAVKVQILQILQSFCDSANQALQSRAGAAPGTPAPASAVPNLPRVAPPLDNSRGTSGVLPSRSSLPMPGMSSNPDSTPSTSAKHASVPAGERDFTFEPIPWSTQPLLGWIQAGAGTDLLWDREKIFVLRGPGAPEVLVSLKAIPPASVRTAGLPSIYPLTPYHANAAPGSVAPEDALTDVVFDGRWAWAPLRDRVLVVDPAGSSYALVGEAEGLPPGRIKIAPLAPGRVCAVGGFGRAWCAILERKGPDAFSVDVFHEARLAEGGWLDASLAFLPRFAAAVRDGDGHAFVLVGRERKDAAQYFPLLLDPDRRQASVIPQRFSRGLNSAVIEADAGDLYWVANTLDLKGEDFIAEHNAEKHCYRLERFTLATRRMEAILGQLPPYSGHSADNPLLDRVDSPKFAFDQGQGYLFTDACWLLDRRSNRLVRLRGEQPRSFIEAGLGRSWHYGLVMILPEANPGQPSCYAFRPVAKLAERLAADAGGRQVIGEKSLEGRFAILRRYPEGADDAWTTFTAPIAAGTLLLERNELSSGTLLALAGEDQRDPVLRQEFGRKFKLFSRNPSDRLFRDNLNVRGDGPIMLPLRTRSYPSVPPQLHGSGPHTITFTDALGHPLAGAMIRPIQGYFPTAPGGNFDPQLMDLTPRSIKLPALYADGAGQIIFENPEPGSLAGGPFEISHPDYGSVKLTLPNISVYTQPGVTEKLPFDTPARQAAPLVHRDSPEAGHAFRGRVLDPQGRPVAGARICALVFRDGMIQQYWDSKIVICDAAGRFRLYPPVPDLFREFLPAITEDSTVTLMAYAPDRLEIPTWIGNLDNRTEHDITLGQPPRKHRFIFEDAQGGRLDPAAIKAVVTCSEASRYRILPGSQVVFDGQAVKDPLAELPLRHGIYSAKAEGNLYFHPVLVTADSPEEIVFKLRVPRPTPTYAQIAVAINSNPVFRRNFPFSLMRDGQVEPMTPPLGPRPMVPPARSANSLALTYTGQVLDAVSGKPLAGAYVMTWDSNLNSSLLTLGDDQWRALHEFHGPYDLDQAGPMAVFKAGLLGRSAITRTDAEGRFILTHKPWETVSGIIAMEQHYLGELIHTQTLTAGAGSRMELPAFKLYPAGHLRVCFAPEKPEDVRKATITADFWFSEPGRGDWNEIFPDVHAGRGMYYLYDVEPYPSPQPQTLPVPAGVEFLVQFSSRWQPLRVGRPLKLRQGETVDLGTLQLRSASGGTPAGGS